jgi:uncharacterized protein YaiE (UPF0345 family)
MPQVNETHHNRIIKRRHYAKTNTIWYHCALYLSIPDQGLSMSEFTNVTIIKKANVYFDGKVSSRTIKFADGSSKTLGFMLPGEYTFNTDAPEIMEIIAGELEVLLPGAEWQIVKGGEAFDVPAKSAFTMKVKTPSDYCCSFIK